MSPDQTVMQSPIHLLFTGNTAWSMYNFRRYVFASLLAEGHKVTVVAPADDLYGKKLEDIGCRFIPLPVDARGGNPFRDAGLFLRLLSLLRAERPDCCFFYTVKPNIYGSLAATWLGIPHVAVVTGLGYVFLNRSLVSLIAKKLYRLAFRRTNEVWFLNNEDRDLFVDHRLVRPGQSFILHGEGIDLTRFACRPLPDGPVTFLLVGRMLWDKGVGDFVEAAARLKKKYPHVRWQLLGAAGADNPSAIPRGQIDRWVEDGLVEYLGVTDDVRPYMLASSCVVLPSYREGVPVSLLEGASLGRPVITTDAPGCRDTVDDGSTGFLSRPGDASGLAAVMERFIQLSPAAQAQMGLAARRKMEQEFGLDRVSDAYRRVVSLRHAM